MATTEKFQKLPDYFETAEECGRASKNKCQTNPRYKGYNQTHFTAGDMNQFEQYRDATNGDLTIPTIDLGDNAFISAGYAEKIAWERYENITAATVSDTFSYLFYKFKKSIFVKIKNNKLKVFLPFSQHNFTNEWGDRIRHDPSKYKSMEDFMRQLTVQQGYSFNPKSVNKFTNGWYANNCLLRYEYPLCEGDSGAPNMKDMFETLCRTRAVPDIEFFVNRRDFPVLKRDLTEPYEHIYDSDTHPLVSHKYEKYSPILGGATADEFADIPIPTWEDWQRVNPHKHFLKSSNVDPIVSAPWDEKKPIAVFRGGSTGCGVTKETNMRLKLAHISHEMKRSGREIIDAGITKWNPRPRKIKGEKYLRTINIGDHPPLVQHLTSQEQSDYKYVINVDGHVTAFRLSLELSYGSVILLVESKYRIWFMSMLVPYVHYVPVKGDLSNLVDKIRWCISHDDECRKIAENAKEFYDKFLCRDSCLDYLQMILVEAKKQMGVYLYNYITPLNMQVKEEHRILRANSTHPATDKTAENIKVIPPQKRSYSLLRGLEWVFSFAKQQVGGGGLEELLELGESIFDSTNSSVRMGELAKFSVAVKNPRSQTFPVTTDHARENIHEAFVASKCINYLLQHIPNFAYVLGFYEDNRRLNIVTEYIDGISFSEYLKQKPFNLAEYVFILLQISLAINVAQNKCGFVHWDMMPWNILIQRLDEPTTIDYLVSYKKVYRVKTSVVPVIIDYGKSHVIYDGKHHGFVNMHKMSTIQDILTILVTSLNDVLTTHSLNREDTSGIIYISNFITGTRYRKQSFNSIRELRSFLYTSKRFSYLIRSDNKDLENKTPLDFFDYLAKRFPSKNISHERSLEFSMNIGNARQVFEFVLSKDKKERVRSYENIFLNFKRSTMPKTENLFFMYYAAQSLEIQLTSLCVLMDFYLDCLKMDKTYYRSIYYDCLAILRGYYDDRIKYTEKSSVTFDEKSLGKGGVSVLDSSIFLEPELVLKKLEEGHGCAEDLSFYKEIIENVMSSRGDYELPQAVRDFYIHNFRPLLNTSSVEMKTSTANYRTLRAVSSALYRVDMGRILEFLTGVDGGDDDYSFAIDRVRLYGDILAIVNSE